MVKHKCTVRCATFSDPPKTQADGRPPNKGVTGFTALQGHVWADGMHTNCRKWPIPSQSEGTFVSGFKLIRAESGFPKLGMVEPMYVLSSVPPPDLNFPHYVYILS